MASTFPPGPDPPSKDGDNEETPEAAPRPPVELVIETALKENVRGC